MFEEIVDILAQQFGVEPDSITVETTFLDDLGADSVDLVELSMALEDEYAIGEMPEDDLSDIKTVGDLIGYIQAHTEAE